MPETLPNPPRPPRRPRKWRFRLAAAVLAPALFFGLLEAGLRGFGYGHPTSFFLKRTLPAGGTVFTENLDFGRRFFPPGLDRAPIALSVSVEKPARTYRVFVLGESAALGIPDPSSSFARSLEVMLRDQYPERRFEVINTAIVAINSHVIREIARECAGHRPDLFVVLMGNNEVVGPFGAAGVIGTHAPSLTLVRAGLLARTTRTGQMIDALVRRLGPNRNAPRFWKGMAMFAWSQVPADDPRLKATYAHFRKNLEDVCRAGTESGARVIVCTVPVNLKDCAPFGSRHAPGLTAADLASWERVYHEGTDLESAGRFAEALRRYDGAARLDGRFADLQFRLARCHAALGHAEEAATRFALARDRDTLRFRADAIENELIRTVAAALRPQGVLLADAERDFSAGGPPGEELFYEHVHMNFEGNCLLARSVFGRVAEIWPATGAAPLSDAACAERLAYTGRERYRDTLKMHEMLREPPFPGQLDGAEREARWQSRLQGLRVHLRPEALDVSLAACRNALRAASDDVMLRTHYAHLFTDLGDLDRAAEEYRAVLRTRPDDYSLEFKLGALALQRRKFDEADARYRAALRIAPGFAGARYGLAEVLAARGKINSAIASYSEQVDREPDRVEALRRFAAFLERLGRAKKAKHCLEEALTLDPDDPLVHVDLANALAHEGDRPGAIAHCEAALRLRPHWPEMAEHLAELRREREEFSGTVTPLHSPDH